MPRTVRLVIALTVCGALAAVVAYRIWQDPQRRFEQARAALRAGDLKRVETAIEALEGNPRYAAHRAFLRGASLLREGRLTEALDELAHCHDHPDLERDTLVLSGQAFYQMGAPGNAKLLWERALVLDADTIDAHRWLGVMYFDLGAMDQALVHLQRVSDLDPLDPRPDRLMGLINKDYERPHLAIPHYQESLRRDAEQADVEQIRLELAEAQIKQKQFDDALATVLACPPSVRQRVLLAECRLNLGDHEAARRLVDQALDEAPLDLDALLINGQILLEAGQMEQAVEAFQQAVDHYPGDYHARYQLAQSLRRAGQADRAQQEELVWEQLRDLWTRFSDLHIDAIDHPADAEIRCEIGEIAEKLGRLELADTWFRAALGIDPASARALRGLDRLAAKQQGHAAELTE